MPSRKDIFVNGGFYHIFNKTLDKRDLFQLKEMSQIFLHLMVYYRSCSSRIRFSHYRRLPLPTRKMIDKKIRNKKNYKVEILAYCLMPNHFHFLLKQKRNNGVIRFMSDTVNSITRYYNEKYKRSGPLFLTQFKSKRIRGHEQLLHTSRYIHLNPYSGNVLKTAKEIETYDLSSFREYITDVTVKRCDTGFILDLFKQNRKRYKEFVCANAEYQRSIERIKQREKFT
ncbi:hypothetical protein COT62_01330 [Candidatus Roizmanbacteria bacterium CG09_land_8_20_14_0_10_41_9]|uniref:Transposase IS200-like domain-containing protein n=1 Tax=Candidatus Roizmanbacteria bacterium CG09_land_8_20_14_0_10_41_9 TaxID=1974850 RepID=A0A2H0WTA0_9BACT|nr:MAG: hypothetical protein COT62_01330 [Candidatus Roizmanbacteria bacterium CG09_land_8_20_14_0_10_41_9]